MLVAGERADVIPIKCAFDGAVEAFLGVVIENAGGAGERAAVSAARTAARVFGSDAERAVSCPVSIA